MRRKICGVGSILLAVVTMIPQTAAFVPARIFCPTVLIPVDLLLVANRRHRPKIRKTSITKIDSFDFSSQHEWDNYYVEQRAAAAAVPNWEEDDNDDPVLEWHSSIPLEILAKYCSTDDANATTTTNNILMIGCGTSRLPDVVHRHNSTATITLLDSSPTCIEQLVRRYGHRSNVRCVCGDATKLSNYFDRNSFDWIIDKGLTDALLCSEGWNGPVEQLFNEAAYVVRRGSFYILVSYQLPRSTVEFLQQQPSWGVWRFNCEGSNDRVQISVASSDLKT
jgi:SAM-dependent methyltransferase